MSGILHAAAARTNAITSGVTGVAVPKVEAPGPTHTAAVTTMRSAGEGLEGLFDHAVTTPGEIITHVAPLDAKPTTTTLGGVRADARKISTFGSTLPEKLRGLLKP